MNWLQSIADEIVFCFRSTFVDPLRTGEFWTLGWPFGRAKPLHGWWQDPHLRFGYLTGLPIALASFALAIHYGSGSPLGREVATAGYLVAFAVWMCVAAWRRDRERRSTNGGTKTD